jgi:DNA modification methylase
MPKSYTSLTPILNQFLCGDTETILKLFPDESIDCIVTSPPYWALRDYGVNGQIGLETSIEDYLDKLLFVFTELKRILKPHGTCWVNFGDTYANKNKGGHRNKPQDNIFDSLTKRATFSKLTTSLSIPPKSLCLIPSRFALGMIEMGWILRNELIWHKPNVMPQSAKDRFTVDFEKLFFFAKSPRYYFEQPYEPLKNVERLQRRRLNPDNQHKHSYGKPFISAINPETFNQSRKRILERGRIKRSVWKIGTRAYHGKHFASYPPQLIEIQITAGCPENGIVLDPFMGSGTTAVVAKQHNRNFIGIDLNSEYVELARKRLE